MKSLYINLLSVIFILCLGIVTYSNTFHCSFHFDDQFFIIDNSAIRDIQNIENIWKYYPCRFITFLSLAWNYHYSQLDVFGYHLFNLAVHLVSAFLVWWLILLTLSTPVMKGPDEEKSLNKKKPLPKSARTAPALKVAPENAIVKHANLIALFVALVFVSHPVQTEAVTYIWQRAASMAALFYVASLCFYVKSRLLVGAGSKPAPTIYYTCALLTAVIAMFTKEDAVTLPLTILLYEFSFFKTNKKLNWVYTVPFLLTLIIVPSTILFTKSAMSHNIQGVVGGEEGVTPLQYLLTQFRVIVTYIRLLLIPIHQNLDYDFPVYKNIFELPVLTSFLFLTAIFYSAIRLFSKYRLLSFSILLFFLTLLPESSVLPLQDLAFEHRLYLPMVGYSLFLVSGAYYVLGKKTVTAMIIFLTMIIICNSILTYQRNKVWKDEITLLNDTIQASPQKSRPYYNRGNEYFNQGKSALALLDFNKAIELAPYTAELYNSRGYFFGKNGKYAQAISDLNKAVELKPGFKDAYINLGNAYNKAGNYAQAISAYNEAIEIDPNDANAYMGRGNTYGKEGKVDQSIADFNKVIELKPEFRDAYSNRGNAYGTIGNYTQAVSDFNKAIELDPNNVDAYVNRGMIYIKEGEITQAIADYDKAIELNPRYALAYYIRGLIYFNTHNLNQAILNYTKAIEIESKYAAAYNNRAVAYYMLKKYENSWEDVQRVEGLGVAVNPGFKMALKTALGQSQ